MHAYGGELFTKFPILTGVRQESVEGPVLFILFLAAVIEVAFPEDSRFCREMGVELEVAKDITDVRRFQRATIIRILDCIYADDITLVSDSLEDMQEIIHHCSKQPTSLGYSLTCKRQCRMPSASSKTDWSMMSPSVTE